MKANYIPGPATQSLLDPDSDVWKRAPREDLQLMGTPVGLQPTQLIRSSWMDKKIGVVERVSVSALHDGETLALRLEWADPIENRDHGDNTSFPDAVALSFPVVADAPMITMGEPGKPISAWYWRADGGHREISAEGIGTSELVDSQSVGGEGLWRDGRWRVCIGRALKVQSVRPVVQLEAGATTKFGVAIWEGSGGERGGVKAFSGPDWAELTLAKREEA